MNDTELREKAARVAALGSERARVPNALPRHVAFIMDGNRRWAKQRKLPYIEGHKAGAEALRNTLEALIDCGVEYATVFAFSSENWRRPLAEVKALFGLVQEFTNEKIPHLMEQGIRVRVIGERGGLPKRVAHAVESVESATARIARPQMELYVAFNYGGRAEIVRAMRLLADKLTRGQISVESICEQSIAQHLYTGGVPDPELVIRTSGEMRFSNFLPWQTAYSEFISVPAYWPDFDTSMLISALQEYQSRARRFGK